MASRVVFDLTRKSDHLSHVAMMRLLWPKCKLSRKCTYLQLRLSSDVMGQRMLCEDLPKNRDLLTGGWRRVDGRQGGLHTSEGAMKEPVSDRKPDPEAVGLKHRLVRCERQWHCVDRTPSQMPEQPRVVIVGAGLAGLCAAHRLLQAGLDDVVVLEALSRPGGRVHTAFMGRTKVDLGGAEIYGPNITNTAFNMAVMENLLEAHPEVKQVGGPYYTSEGVALANISRPHEIFSKAIQETARIFYSSKKSRSSVKEVMKPKIKKELENVSEFEQPDEIAMIMIGLENQARVRLGDDLSNLSADYLGSYVELSDGYVPLEKGGSSLLGPLLAVAGSRVRYSKPVQNIRWGTRLMRESKRGSVLCCDGEEIPCDFVICTVSLGVLKSQAETLFSPPLPEDKLKAIRNLGFGHVAKIYLEYDRPFWAPGEGVFNVCWSPDRKGEDWMRGIGSIEEVSRTVLKVCIAGREAVWSESCGDRTIAEDLTALLRKLLGDTSLPCPRHVVRSRWSSDIHFKGALTYLGLQSSVQDQCTLMAPAPDAPSVVPPVLLFAGEATVPGHSSSLHGAMLSGYREADRVLAISRQHKGPPKPPKTEKKKVDCS